MTADEVLNGLRDIAKDPGANARARVKALELLGKRHRLFTERVEHGGEVSQPIKLVTVVEPHTAVEILKEIRSLHGEA